MDALMQRYGLREIDGVLWITYGDILQQEIAPDHRAMFDAFVHNLRLADKLEALDHVLCGVAMGADMEGTRRIGIPDPPPPADEVRTDADNVVRLADRRDAAATPPGEGAA